MAMTTEERKRLIAKGKENDKIAEARAEEKRILSKKPVYRMEPDPRLKFMSKADATKLLEEKREAMARGVAVMGGVKEAPKETPKAPEAPEAPAKEKSKTRKRRGSTKVT